MNWKKSLTVLALGLAILVGLAIAAQSFLGEILPSFGERFWRKSANLESRTSEFREPVKTRTEDLFRSLSLTWPVHSGRFVYFKDQRLLHVFVRHDEESPFVLFKTYPALAASGKLGPKIQEGDRQVPEGVYKIESLNPNSIFHLSLRVNYPSFEDRRIAKDESRESLGGDIMIHGSAVSTGCIAVGDEAIEEIFVLVADSKNPNWDVWIAPKDFRIDPTMPEDIVNRYPWMKSRYEDLAEKLQKLPGS